MATLEDYQDKLVALEEAYSSGVLHIKHKDVETTFRSLDELGKAIAFVQSRIRQLSGDERQVRVTRERED